MTSYSLNYSNSILVTISVCVTILYNKYVAKDIKLNWISSEEREKKKLLSHWLTQLKLFDKIQDKKYPGLYTQFLKAS